MVVRDIKNRDSVFILLLLLCIFQAPLYLYVGGFDHIDELIPACIIPVFAIEFLRSKGSMWYTKGQVLTILMLGIFVVLGWISWARGGFMPFLNGLLDCFGNLKFFITIGTSWLFFRDVDFERIEKKLWMVMRPLTLFLFILTILDETFHIFKGEIRYGLMSIRLFFGLYTFLAAECVLICAVFIRLYEYYKEKVLPWLGMLWFIMFMTLRTKAWVALVMMVFLYASVCARRTKLNPLVWVMALALMALVSYNQFSYYFLELAGESARYSLTVTSPRIARDFFPLGCGWASFGSGFSVSPYSPIYRAYGLDYVWGLSPDYPAYISDCFWPMILAQTGWFGMASYAAAVIVLIREIVKMGERNAYSLASGLSVIIYLLISSTSEASFTLAFAVHYGVWLGFILAENGGRVRFLRSTAIIQGNAD